MGYNYDNTKTIKICVIGGSNEIIKKLFPDTIKSPNDVQYIKRKRCKILKLKILQQ